MPRALQAGETGGGSGRWGGIGRQRWHIHAAVSEHADGDGLALLQQAKDLLRRAESGEREFAERGEFTAAMPRELIIGLIGVISFAFSIGWDSYHGEVREEEGHGTAAGRQQAGSCEIPQTEPKKQDRRGHVSGA